MKILKLLLLITLFFPGQSFAEATDWNSVVKELALNGVKATSVDWTTVNSMCSAHGDDKVLVSKCQVEKALLENQFKEDKSYCKKRSELVFPNALTKEKKFEIQATDQEGRKYVLFSEQPLYKKSEIKNLRELQKDECLHLLNWKSTSSWETGHRN